MLLAILFLIVGTHVTYQAWVNVLEEAPLATEHRDCRVFPYSGPYLLASLMLTQQAGS
jgi:hypothetical protein